VRHRDPIVAAFARVVARDPSRPLLLARRRHADAAEIDRLARLARAALDGAAVAPGQLVGLLAANGSGFVAALVACLSTGRTPVLLEQREPEASTRRATDELGVETLLHVERAWPRAVADFRVERRGTSPGEAPAGIVDGGRIVKLTSGSAGACRGVVVSSEALIADDEALRSTMQVDERDRLLAAVPFAHSYGLSSLVLPALVHGIALVVPEGAGPFDTLEAARSCGATVLPTTPPWISAMVRLAEPPPLPSTLRRVIAAGSVLLPRTALEFRQRFGRPVHVFYGASECGGIAYDREGDAAERGTAGEPIEGVRVEIEPLEGETGSITGRIAVASPAVAERYLGLGHEDLAGGRFVSRDVGRLVGRELRLTGRIEDLVDLPGGLVNRRDVELAIAELEQVEDVVIYEPEPAPRATSVGVAVVACAPGSLTSERVLAWSRRRLGADHAPRGVILVRRLPRTTRGKIDLAWVARLGSRTPSTHA
jgi:long-chain acyl-CoA synthetase